MDDTRSTWKVNPSILIYLGRIILSVILFFTFLSQGEKIKSLELNELYEYGVALMVGVICINLLLTLILAYTTLYELTENRIIVKEGILVQRRNEIELYRVKDYELIRPLFLRIIGLSHIRLISSDALHPEIQLKGIVDGETKLNQIRDSVERLRIEKRVFEVD